MHITTFNALLVSTAELVARSIYMSSEKVLKITDSFTLLMNIYLLTY
jgi:hypothetical protein